MSRARGLFAIAVVCLLWGACAGPKPAARRPDGCQTAAPKTGHGLEIYLSVDRDGDKRPLCPGEVLSARDTLLIGVDLDIASHVRMVFIAPDGQAGELLRQDEADLTRAANFRAPEGLLAYAAGEAQLFIVASQEPLEQSDATMQMMLDVIRDTGTLVDRDGSLRPPPPGSAAPPDMLKLETSEDLFADFDDKGMAMLAISLRTGR